MSKRKVTQTLKPLKKLKSNSESIRIATWNVCGLRALLKRNALVQLLEEEDPHILCLNETKLQENHVEQIKAQLPSTYYSYWNCSTAKKGYSGVAILSKTEPLNVTYGIGISKHDLEGRAVIAEYNRFYVVSTYVPNAGDGLWRLGYRTQEWDLDLRTYLDKLQKTKPVIWAGDLNVIHEDIDIHNIKGKEKCACCTPEERGNFSETLETNKFLDTFRMLNPGVKGWSYYPRRNVKAKEKGQGWRLDYIVVSQALKRSVMKAYIRDDIDGSDHHPCLLDLSFRK